ncbi:MAG: hypothetical protein D3923_04330 [Candidatus Electrothrix sp. AR3]|nr:hypothetical protein [Candidatus Electrothrix sp. AR3]
MQKFLGLIILLAVVAVAAGYFILDKGKGDPLGISSFSTPKEKISVVGKAGSEKMIFLQSEPVQKILAKHGLEVKAKKAGSIEMMQEAGARQDFLWPASQINLEFFNDNGGKILQSADVFNSPLVLYSWDIVTDALITAGIVEYRQGVNYVVDLTKLLSIIIERQNWKAIGLQQLYGKIMIRTTDPTKSNSGNMFAALVANTLNLGEVVTLDSVDEVLPRVKEFYGRLGHTEHSSAVLFNMFLQQGVGAYPIIVGYENQLVEYSLLHKEALELLRSKVRILYPVPTVWASHPFIALNEKGKKLLAALKDPEIQQLAWETHGFRSGLMGVENDPSVLEVVGLPKSIDAVMPTPNAKVMSKMIQELRF